MIISYNLYQNKKYINYVCIYIYRSCTHIHRIYPNFATCGFGYGSGSQSYVGYIPSQDLVTWRDSNDWEPKDDMDVSETPPQNPRFIMILPIEMLIFGVYPISVTSTSRMQENFRCNSYEQRWDWMAGSMAGSTPPVGWCGGFRLANILGILMQ